MCFNGNGVIAGYRQYCSVSRSSLSEQHWGVIGKIALPLHPPEPSHRAAHSVIVINQGPAAIVPEPFPAAHLLDASATVASRDEPVANITANSFAHNGLLKWYPCPSSHC